MELQVAKLPTLKVTEAVAKLRELGVKTSPMKLMAGIKQGVYPFGIHIRMGKDEYEIYEVLFNEWVKERIAQQQAERS